ncbi:MAG: hypothetical protein WBK24_07685, partial [Dethiobacteria bacterium]
ISVIADQLFSFVGDVSYKLGQPIHRCKSFGAFLICSAACQLATITGPTITGGRPGFAVK